MLNGMPEIQFEGVSKRFGERQALAGLSFSADAGKIVGLLGPNGSGKTTTIRLMLNLFYPDDGHIRLFGLPPSPKLCDRIGYLPEERGLYRRMRVWEVLTYYARLKGVKVAPQKIDEWLARVGIAEYREQRVQELSKGTAQKVQFVATVLHDPALLIFDELFSGIDPLSREQLRAALRYVLALGKTVIVSTHDMAEAESMCDSFLILNRGRKVLDADRAQIATQFGELRIKLRVEGPLPELTTIACVTNVLDLGTHHEVLLSDDGDPQTVLGALSGRCSVLKFEVARPSLHDIFLRLAQEASP